MARDSRSGGPFRFRVSDAVQVPLRGYLLRLRVLEGQPSIRDVKPGRTLRLVDPQGRGRTVTVLAHSITGGRQTQKRLDETRELDIIVSERDATEREPVQIGWSVTGPEASSERAA